MSLKRKSLSSLLKSVKTSGGREKPLAHHSWAKILLADGGSGWKKILLEGDAAGVDGITTKDYAVSPPNPSYDVSTSSTDKEVSPSVSIEYEVA